MTHQLIETDTALVEVLDRHASDNFVAVDTEFRRRDTFFPQVALLQLCWRKDAYLIDPTKFFNFGPVVELLSNPQVIKLIHSPSEDLEVFDRWLQVLPSPLFDTQRALAVLGRGFGLGYRAMVEMFTGDAISKEETTSDWLKRPLTDRQLSYAALDVTYLRQIGEELYDACRESQRLSWVLEDTARLKLGGRGPAAKFKSAWKMSLREQAVLSRLIDWREEEARRLDRPRSWVVPDKVLVTLAKRQPMHLAQLSSVDGLHDAIIRKRGKRIVEVVSGAIDNQAPQQAFWQSPLRSSHKQWASTLGETVTSRAQELGVAPEVLYAGRDIERLIQATLDQQPIPKDLLGWRDSVITQHLVDLLAPLVRVPDEIQSANELPRG
ncbi:MAG: ribonuclease D [Halieaceae bacterium MED-G26]|nr:MAG: ribonuclease D [Halieaceae bacterium MED-G26]